MSQTSIPLGHPLARKVFGAAVFAELVQKPGLWKNLTGPAPMMGDVVGKLERMQTPPSHPVVRVTDLSRGAGDTVSLDMFNILEGRPVMGDRKIAGRMMKLTSSTMEIRLNQTRGGVDSGGRMAQQRTVHNLRTVGRAGLTGWYNRYASQVKMVHLAGARGSHNTPEWVIPEPSDPEFAEVMVNSVLAPTYDRHFYAGDATGLSDLDTTHILTLDDIDRLAAAVSESDVMLQPVVLPDDPAADEEALYVLLVTSRQWHYLQNRTGEKAWRTFLQNAQVRGSKNPLFAGNPGMWNGVLVKRYPLPIRFNQGDTITIATSAAAYTETTVQIGATQFSASNPERHCADRAILLGAQALGEVFGRHTKSGTFFNWHEEESDHGAAFEASVAAMGGFAKLRFRSKAGRDFDNGVMVLDSYAPDPRYITVA